MSNPTITLTAREATALADIVREGGGLAGGRQNTRTQNRLLAKGMIVCTYDVRRFVATPAGECFVTTKVGA